MPGVLPRRWMAAMAGLSSMTVPASRAAIVPRLTLSWSAGATGGRYQRSQEIEQKVRVGLRAVPLNCQLPRPLTHPPSASRIVDEAFDRLRQGATIIQWYEEALSTLLEQLGNPSHRTY